MRPIVTRLTISTVAGFLASAFALGALVLSERPDPLTGLIEDGRPSANVLVGLLAAVWGAGIPVALTVLACLLVNDIVRSLIRQLSLRRDAFLPTLRAARSIWAATVKWVRQAAIELARLAIWIVVGGGAVLLYLFALSAGVLAVRESTRWVRALLEDPPGGAATALGMTGAAVVMYLGLGLLAACLWVLYRGVRVSIRAF